LQRDPCRGQQWGVHSFEVDTTKTHFWSRSDFDHQEVFVLGAADERLVQSVIAKAAECCCKLFPLPQNLTATLYGIDIPAMPIFIGPGPLIGAELFMLLGYAASSPPGLTRVCTTTVARP